MSNGTPKIEKGIPLPPRQQGMRKGPTVMGLLREMEVGDSFVIPNPKKRPLENVAGAVRSNSYTLKPKVFAVRFVDEGGVRVVRIWRTA